MEREMKRMRTAVSAAGKEEAGKPMGDDELPLIEESLRNQAQLGVGDIPGMRAPMSMTTTPKFLSGTLSHANFWTAKILGYISPASSGYSKSVRAHGRWNILVKRSTRMLRVGLDFASWSVGQLCIVGK